MEVYCCCIVKRTVAAVPVIGGFSSFQPGNSFDLNNGKEMQMVKIERNRDKSENRTES